MSIKELYEEKIREVLADKESILGETILLYEDNITDIAKYVSSLNNPFINRVEVDRGTLFIIFHNASYLAEKGQIQELDDFCRNETYIRPRTLKEGTIIDEEKSVRWNREEVVRRNEKNKKMSMDDRHYHNLLDNAISEVIKKSADGWYMTEFSDEAINIIYNKAWEDGHSYGFMEVYSYFSDYMEMFVDACKAMNFI